jgi:hypothetical protein
MLNCFVVVNENFLFKKNQINTHQINGVFKKYARFSNKKHFECQMNSSKYIRNIRNSMKNFYVFLKKSYYRTSIINLSALYFTNSIIIDTSKLNIKQEDIINDSFLFSHKTTEPSEIEAEIQEIEDDEYRYRTWKNTQIGLALGGSAIGMWFAYKGLNVWEKWMKDQEQKDIEEEIQMTGTYINPGAGNVEISIDPITGKKIQIKPSKKDSSDK